MSDPTPTEADKAAAEELADELLLDTDTPERIIQVAGIIARHMQAEREAFRAQLEFEQERSRRFKEQLEAGETEPPEARDQWYSGWQTAHESAPCGHARANIRDPKFGTWDYQGEERCEMCELEQRYKDERQLRQELEAKLAECSKESDE
jgi:hypothetical protein